MTAQGFRSFVLFAEMRTGSNFLEANLNAIDGIVCHGEAFNPHFIGYPNKTELLGITQTQRDDDPGALLSAIRSQTGAIGGFRYFHDHDPRVLDAVMADTTCAKVILTRNPVDSYVSWKIAQATGQWKLTDMKRRKDGQAVFDADEFSTHLAALQAFQVTLLNRLQTSGQTAFYVSYEDLQNLDVMNGLARFLGVSASLGGLDTSLKVQNPQPISEKVANFAEMEQALSGLDRFNLTRTPNFEPRRAAAIPSYIAAARAPLMYLPVRGGPEDAVQAWLADLDGVATEDLPSRFSQKDLRQWKRQNKGHRSFTVLRHPVARAHHVFCARILNTDEGAFGAIRQTLKKRYKLPIPGAMPNDNYDIDAHRAAFAAFLTFLKGNLTGQTAVRVDANWCSQAQVLQGFGEFALPDRIIREESMAQDLQQLAHSVGCRTVPDMPTIAPDAPFTLPDIYDDTIEALARDAYQRDYMMFGFQSWG